MWERLAIVREAPTSMIRYCFELLRQAQPLQRQG